jgi:hypothetical protein
VINFTRAKINKNRNQKSRCNKNMMMRSKKKKLALIPAFWTPGCFRRVFVRAQCVYARNAGFPWKSVK